MWDGVLLLKVSVWSNSPIRFMYNDALHVRSSKPPHFLFTPS